MAGNLSSQSGTLYKDVTISATEATKMPEGTGEVTLNNRSIDNNLVIPKDIHVVLLTAQNPMGSGVSNVSATVRRINGDFSWMSTSLNEGFEEKAYIGVTPEKTYTLRVVTTDPKFQYPIFKVSWSPEINQHKPYAEDYITD